MLASYFATYKERHPGPLALALVGPVSFELEPHPDIVVTGAVSEADKWDIVRDALVAVSPSALESFSLVVIEAWVDRVPVLVNGACGPTRGALRALGRGTVVHLLPRVRGRARAARRPTPRCGRVLGDARAALRRPPLPLAGAGRALRRVPRRGGGAGQGYARPVLSAALALGSEDRAARRRCTSAGRWRRSRCRAPGGGAGRAWSSRSAPKPSRASMETTAPG